MKDTCAKCGQEVSWFEKRGEFPFPLGSSKQKRADFVKNHPEYQGKRLCSRCTAELMGYVTLAEYADMKRQNKPPPISQSGFERQFKDALEQGRRQVILNDTVLSADGIGKHIKSASQIAQKYGYCLKQTTNTSDNHYITMIFEKVVTTTNETNFVNCRYCNTHYDANQYFKCPQCGSPTT